VRKRLFSILFLGIWAATAATGSHAQPRSAGEEPRLLAVYGLPSVEQLRDGGAQVRRVFYVDGNGFDVIALSFVRGPASPPEVTVHFPPREGQPPREPLRAQLTPTVWNDVLQRSEIFDRTLAPVAGPEPVRLCSHSWTYTAEASDPAEAFAQATMRRATQDACDEGLVQPFAVALYQIAAPLFPQCDLLDRDQHRNGATLLAQCGMLSGDTIAAAEAYNRIGGLKGGGNPEYLPLLRSILHGATLEWDGVRLGSAPEAWLARTSGASIASFFPLAARGETSARVRMTGTFERWVDLPGGSVRENAPVELIWVRRQDGSFTVSRAVVGAFVRAPRR
jgi:hypothetical protein